MTGGYLYASDEAEGLPRGVLAVRQRAGCGAAGAVRAVAALLVAEEAGVRRGLRGGARGGHCDALEAEARRRAVEGVRKPVFYQGVICGWVGEYSDTLLIFLLKGFGAREN